MTEIRRLRAVEVRELRTLLKTCWLDTYAGILSESIIRTANDVWHSEESLIRGLTNEGTYYAGYFEDGELLGMASASKIADDTLKVYQLYVRPESQRKGIGTRLMDFTIRRFEGVRRVVLEVEEGNQKGISFYRKYGFTYPSRSVMRIGNEGIPCLVGEFSVA